MEEHVTNRLIAQLQRFSYDLCHAETVNIKQKCLLLLANIGHRSYGLNK